MYLSDRDEKRMGIESKYNYQKKKMIVNEKMKNKRKKR